MDGGFKEEDDAATEGLFVLNSSKLGGINELDTASSNVGGGTSKSSCCGG